MNAISTNIVAETATVAAPKVYTLKGAGKAKREAAYATIALSAYIATQSYEDMLDTIRAALGANPTVDDVKVAQREYVIGRASARLPATEYPKGIEDDMARLAHVRELVLHFAKPDTKTLRKSHKGKRSELQHKAIRAAEQAWSMVAGDLGIGTSQGNEGRKGKRRKPRTPSGAGKSGTTPTAPTHGELVASDKPLTAADVVNFLATQSTMLMQYCKRNAGITPATMAALTNKFRADITKLASEWKLEQDAKDAIRAAAEK